MWICVAGAINMQATQEEKDKDFEYVYGESDSSVNEDSHDKSDQDSYDELPEIDATETNNEKYKESSDSSEFKFDSEKYKDITDQEVLKKLEAYDRQEFDKSQKPEPNNFDELDARVKEIESELKKIDEEDDNVSDDEYSSLLHSDPKKAIKIANEAQKKELKIQALNNEMKQIHTQKFVASKVPEYEDLIPNMTDIIRSDLGNSYDAKKIAKNFANNPYSIDGAMALNLAERAKGNIKIANLEKEVKDLKMKLKTAGNEVIGKINKMGKTPHVKGQSDAKSKETKRIAEQHDIFTSSADDLRKFL